MEPNKEINKEPNKNSIKKSLSDLLKLEYFMLFLVGISLFGLVIIVLYALIQPSSWTEKASAFGMFIFIAIATFLTGLLIGFIFGVPRVTESKNEGTNGETEQLPTQKAVFKLIDRHLYIENSNLERISDWLTTGIVAIALTNLNSIPQKLLEFSWYIGQSLNNSGGVYGNFTVNGESTGIPASGILGSFVLVGYSIDGFLIGYLGTRRRAAVDFGKGLYGEESIIHDMEVMKDESGKYTEEDKKKAEEDVKYQMK